VGGALDHLGRKVVEGPAHCGSAGVGGVDRPSKVGDLNVAANVQEKVLRLDVSVNDFLAVAVGKRVCHLADVQGRLGLGKPAVLLFLKTLVELPTRCILQNEVNPALVVEITKQPKNIWVAKMGLDLDLSAKLVLYLRLLQLGLEENLESNNVLALLLSGQVDIAKLALAKGAPNVEVVELPALTGTAGWTCWSACSTRVCRCLRF